MKELFVHGIPEQVSEPDAAVLRTRLLRAVDDLRRESSVEEIGILVTTAKSAASRADTSDLGESRLAERASRYSATPPLWNLGQLVASTELLDEVRTAVELIRLEPLVFDAWGLRAVEPFPRAALNFHGPPGTGKTMTAHAVASELGKPIISASYADIESKYHGDGPKNVEALFYAAEHNEAVLFIDEADSLLSKRLTSVSQGSEQAINSMRSQILICLERYRGVVIFATNLVTNYDEAFETRVRHIHFPMPGVDARAAIWRKHLLPTLPLAYDVDASRLAEREEDFCGRDIKNAVVNTALRVASQGRQVISQADFELEISRIVAARNAVRGGQGVSVSLGEEEKTQIEQKVVHDLSFEKDTART